MHARPHINGNSPKDFADAATELLNACQAVTDAVNKIGAEVMHGRNYQHISDNPADLRDADMKALRAQWQQIEGLKIIARKIYEVAISD